MTNSFQAAFRLLPYISYSFRPIPNSFRTAYWHNLIVFPTVNTNSNMIKTFFDLFWIVLINDFSKIEPFLYFKKPLQVSRTSANLPNFRLLAPICQNERLAMVFLKYRNGSNLERFVEYYPKQWYEWGKF